VVQRPQRGDAARRDYGRISAAPGLGTTEKWILKNGGRTGSPHPHPFRKGQILDRNGSASNVAAWEKGARDVYRLRPNGTVTMRHEFRDWSGMFMEHRHNTVHEDNAMLAAMGDRQRRVALPASSPDAPSPRRRRHVPSTRRHLPTAFERTALKINSRVVALSS